MARYINRKQKVIEAYEYNDFTVAFRLPNAIPFDSSFIFIIFYKNNPIITKPNPIKNLANRKLTFQCAKQETDTYGGKDLWYELIMVTQNEELHKILEGVFKLRKTLYRQNG
jgi:hypothetical protein